METDVNMSIAEHIKEIKNELPSAVRLVAVSKFHPSEVIREAYGAGQRIFGESRPQELYKKVGELPSDIEWHFIGHLQSNKLKFVLPYVSLIHSVDSKKLFYEIIRYAADNNLNIKLLLEVHIAMEESKQGFSKQELLELLEQVSINPPSGVDICGLMGMASFVEDYEQIRREFKGLVSLFSLVKERYGSIFPDFKELSMGMSNDYRIAVECGSTMIRIGSRIFGARV